MPALPTDTAGVPTSAQFVNPSTYVPGTAEWAQINMTADGGDKTQGAKADVAVTSVDSTPGTTIGLLKGIISRLNTLLAVGVATMLKAEDAPHASGDAGVMTLAVRKNTAAASSGADGDYEPLQTDSTGRLRVTNSDARIGALSNARTTALDNILLVKGSAGTLFGFQGYTDADGYVVVIADADGTISNGVQCLEVIHVVDPAAGGAGGPFSLDFGAYGLAVATGICLAFSTTGPTFTDGGNHMFASAQYE